MRTKKRVHRDCGPRREKTFELIEGEAAAAEIGAEVRLGDLVYAPPPAVPAAYVHRDDPVSASKQRRPLAPPARPPSVEPLRGVLRTRGLDLEDQSAFYWRVVDAPRAEPRAQQLGTYSYHRWSNRSQTPTPVTPNSDE